MVIENFSKPEIMSPNHNYTAPKYAVLDRYPLSTSEHRTHY